MNYFDKNNDVLLPYKEYDIYSIYSIDSSNKTAGIEYYFDFNNKESSYYEKIICDSLNTAFKDLKLNKIYVNVIRDNYAMFSVLRKFNFVSEAIHREQYFDDIQHDVVFMTVLKHEWENGGIKENYSYDSYAVKQM